MHLYPVDGAVHRQKKDAAAWGYRDAAWSMVISGIDPDPAKAPALKQWAQAYWAAVHPFNLPGAYPNFMMDDEGEARVKAAYGGNYDRLASLKKKYDPGEPLPCEPEHPPGGLTGDASLTVCHSRRREAATWKSRAATGLGGDAPGFPVRSFGPPGTTSAASIVGDGTLLAQGRGARAAREEIAVCSVNQNNDSTGPLMNMRSRPCHRSRSG